MPNLKRQLLPHELPPEPVLKRPKQQIICRFLNFMGRGNGAAVDYCTREPQQQQHLSQFLEEEPPTTSTVHHDGFVFDDLGLAEKDALFPLKEYK